MLRIVPIRRYPRCYTCVGALFPGVREAPCCPFAAPRQSRSRAATAPPCPISCPAAESHPFPHAAACPSHGTAHERWRHASSDASTAGNSGVTHGAPLLWHLLSGTPPWVVQ